MGSRKMSLMNLVSRQQWTCRHRAQTCGHSEVRRGWGKLKEWHGDIHITICKTDSQWEFAAGHRDLNPVLCDSLEGWDGAGDRSEDQEEEDRCIPMADSCGCMTEANTVL